MLPEIFFEIHKDLPREGPGRDRYPRRAFEMLPPMGNPRILDIGCGPGGQTLALSRLSGGEITAIDTHEPYLDRLREKIDAADVGGRVRALNLSMFEMEFDEESFDLIWSEGAIYIIGFERGLREWKRLIRPGGFLVVHDVAWIRPDPPEEIVKFWAEGYPAIRTAEENIRRIDDGGYRLLGHFTLPEDAWWVEYYEPLEKRVARLREKYRGDADALEILESERVEIDMYKKYKAWYGSVFFVMQRPFE